MLVFPETHWSHWGKYEWNIALFLHYFDASNDNPTPVRTLSVTPETLALITRDNHAIPEESKTSFFKAVGQEPSVIRKALSPEKYVGRMWLHMEPPPFFIYLIFTCFVATASDDSIRSEGNFRTRIQKLLKKEETCSFQLTGLNQVWKLLKEWLTYHRNDGFPYRDIVLPDPGKMNLIGYSINIAFPKMKDLNRLIHILKESRSDDDIPTQIEIIMKLDNMKRDLFSESFQKEYDSFKNSFYKRSLDTSTSFFWSAVKDAWVANFHQDKKDKVKFGLILERTEFDENLYLVSDRNVPIERTGNLLQFVERDNITDFKFVAVPNIGIDHSRESKFELLLSAGLINTFPLLKKSALGTSLNQGFLLFVKNDIGWFEWKNNYEIDDTVKVSIKKFLREEFLAIFPEKNRPVFREESRDSKWLETEPFNAQILLSIEIPKGSIFWNVRCLQAPIWNSGIALSDGVRTGSVYLGIPPCLPKIRATNADYIEIQDGPNGVFPRIVKSADNADVFLFDVPLSTTLEGKYTILARSGDNHVGMRTVEFASTASPSDFKFPKSTANCFIEGPGPDICEHDLQRYGWYLAKERPTPTTKHSHPAIKGYPYDLQTDLVESYDALSSTTASFMEICAAKFARKQGITESEFIELQQQIFPHEKNGMMWDLSRSWVENCYFEKLTDRKWKANYYYPVLPHLILHSVGKLHQATLVGLTTCDLRRFISASMSALGATRKLRYSYTPLVPAPPMWSCENDDVFRMVAEEAKIPTMGLKDTSPGLWTLEEITAGGSHPPSGYEVISVWDRKKEKFVDFKEDSDTSHHVRMQMMGRSRQDAPDYYLISQPDGRLWWTYSRNWALLTAYTFSGTMPFSTFGDSHLFSVGWPRIYLPLAYARQLSILSDIVPSPFTATNGKPGYAYHFPSGKARQIFIDSFWGKDSGVLSIGQLELMELLMDARRMRRIDEPKFPLSKEIRDYLGSLGRNHRIDELIHSRFIPSTLHAVVECMKKIGFSKGDI